MEDDIIKIIVLAIIQGITEFLPISSSGHLVVFQKFLNFEKDNLYHTVILHAGTLLSIVVFYFADLRLLLKSENRREIYLIIIGTIPIVVIGMLAKPIIDDFFGSLWIVAVGLLFTSTMLLFLHVPKSGSRTINDLSWKEALIIGMFQCIAIIPGISRSGSTISIASRLGVAHESAAKFSFFLGIIAISGATVLEMKDVLFSHTSGVQTESLTLSFVGFVVSFVVGYFSLKLLIRMLRDKTFSYFGYYCLSISIILIVVSCVT